MLKIRKIVERIRYILFALKFLWDNKSYPTNRNKFRRMDREYKKKYKWGGTYGNVGG